MNTLSRCQPLLGTYGQITIAAELDDAALLAHSEHAFKRIRMIDQAMGFHRLDGELSWVNQYAHGRSLAISPDLATVRKQALALSALTDGATISLWRHT